jgi:hypothetical protein
LGNGRAGALDLVDKFTAHMDHAGLFVSLALAEQSVEPGKAIGMDRAGIACKMVSRVLALSINAELIPGAGSGKSTA